MSTPLDQKSGCTGLLLKLLGKAPASAPSLPDSAPLPYRLRDDFLSPAEVSFYHVLRTVCAERFTVCTKVNLRDLFFVANPHQNQAARNRIDRKHVDFLLCEPGSMRPQAGIELDDASHSRADREERDALLAQVFEAAGLPLVRFAAQHAYVIEEVAARIGAVFGEESSLAPEPVAEAAEPEVVAVPQCPKCGVTMVMRRGPGGQFFGCRNYPRCRATVGIP